MPSAIATITRLEQTEVATWARMTAFRGTDLEFDLAIVELPWRWNEPNRSCIPCGTYQVVPYDSPRFGTKVMWIQDVPGRTWILQHAANFAHELQGCQAPGLYHRDIDGDGVIDVANSRAAMAKILAWAPEGYVLHIVGG